MIEVVTTKLWHVESIVRRAAHASEPKATEVGCLKHTFLLGDKPMAIWGGVFPLPHMFQWCAVMSDLVTERPLEFFKKSKALMDAYMVQYKLTRMETVVRAEYKMGRKFAEKLGFEPEGTLRRYGCDGSDYVMYARLT